MDGEREREKEKERKKCGTATAAAAADSCIIMIMDSWSDTRPSPLLPSAVDLFVAEWMKGLLRKGQKEGEEREGGCATAVASPAARAAPCKTLSSIEKGRKWSPRRPPVLVPPLVVVWQRGRRRRRWQISRMRD